MSKTLKLIFDEWLGRPFLDPLKELLSTFPSPFELAHVLDCQRQGVPDAE